MTMGRTEFDGDSQVSSALLSWNDTFWRFDKFQFVYLPSKTDMHITENAYRPAAACLLCRIALNSLLILLF